MIFNLIAALCMSFLIFNKKQTKQKQAMINLDERVSHAVKNLMVHAERPLLNEFRFLMPKEDGPDYLLKVKGFHVEIFYQEKLIMIFATSDAEDKQLELLGRGRDLGAKVYYDQSSLSHNGLKMRIDHIIRSEILG